MDKEQARLLLTQTILSHRPEVDVRNVAGLAAEMVEAICRQYDSGSPPPKGSQHTDR